MDFLNIIIFRLQESKQQMTKQTLWRHIFQFLLTVSVMWGRSARQHIKLPKLFCSRLFGDLSDYIFWAFTLSGAWYVFGKHGKMVLQKISCWQNFAENRNSKHKACQKLLREHNNKQMRRCHTECWILEEMDWLQLQHSKLTAVSSASLNQVNRCTQRDSGELEKQKHRTWLLNAHRDSCI